LATVLPDTVFFKLSEVSLSEMILVRDEPLIFVVRSADQRRSAFLKAASICG